MYIFRALLYTRMSYLLYRPMIRIWSEWDSGRLRFGVQPAWARHGLTIVQSLTTWIEAQKLPHLHVAKYPHRDVNWQTFCPTASLVVLAPDNTLFTTHIMVHRNSYHYIERQYWPHQTWLSMLLQQNVFLNSAKSHFFQRALYNEMKYKSRFTIGIQLYWWRVGKSSRHRDLAEVSGTFWNTFYSKSNQRATPFLQLSVETALVSFVPPICTFPSSHCRDLALVSYCINEPRLSLCKMWRNCKHANEPHLDNYYLSVSRTIKRDIDHQEMKQ